MKTITIESKDAETFRQWLFLAITELSGFPPSTGDGLYTFPHFSTKVGFRWEGDRVYVFETENNE